MKNRYQRTVDFVKKHVNPEKRILDIGTPNRISEMLKSEGFNVINTDGRDLDVDFAAYAQMDVDVITAFEIFEHLLAPFNLLRALKAKEMVVSVPLNLWFASAYWHPTDVWDRHYHDFEPKQFDMLLDRTGWDIVSSEKWTSPEYRKIGFRPILRLFTKRHYILHCRRKPDYIVPTTN
jgi:hypothetical protein